jgi:hypothetical protein
MKITWTLLAKKTYNKNIEFLLKTGNINIVQDFILEVEQTMNLIKTNPNCFEKWDLDITYNKGFIHKNISFYYKVQNNEIVVYLFWNNLQNPKKLKKLLSNTK